VGIGDQFSLIREFDLDISMDGFIFIYSSTELMGQQLLDPPDVSGWDGHRTWITATNLVLRWDVAYAILAFQVDDNPDSIMDFIKTLTNNSNDPAYITRTWIDHFFLRGLLSDADYDEATDIFKGEVPQNYFDDGTWNLDWDIAVIQVVLLHTHLTALPAFQLS